MLLRHEKETLILLDESQPWPLMLLHQEGMYLDKKRLVVEGVYFRDIAFYSMADSSSNISKLNF